MKPLVYNEIFELFEILGKDKKSKIPSRFWKFVEKNKLIQYDKSKIIRDIWNGTLSEDAKNLYGLLKLKYLCDDDLEKKILYETYRCNSEIKKEKKKMNIMHIKTNLIENNSKINQEKIKTQKTEIIEYKKEKWYKIILTKIVAIFKKNKG